MQFTCVDVNDFASFIRKYSSNNPKNIAYNHVSFDFANGPPDILLRNFARILKVIGTKLESVKLCGMKFTDEFQIMIIDIVDECCTNLKEFSAESLVICQTNLISPNLQLFFGKMEKIELSMCSLDNELCNTFSDCKKLKEFHLNIFFEFDGCHINYNFPQLKAVTFTNIDGIDNEHINMFLLKNPQIEKLELTKCPINPKILKIVANHAPNIKEIAFNFRRRLLKRSDMLHNMKYLLDMKHLTTLNLDCCGLTIADILIEMGQKQIPIQHIGLFCCQWQNKLTEAFANFKQLKYLNLSNIFGMADSHLECLSISQLTKLTLRYNKTATIDGVISFVQNVPHLAHINLYVKKMSLTIARYRLLSRIVKERVDPCKLTLVLWGQSHNLKVPKELMKRNSDFLEIIIEENELNSNTRFDFYCDKSVGDGGYDIAYFDPPYDCPVN